MLDLLIRSARILTVDPDRPRASSLGIWNGRIVGLDEQVDGMTSHEVVDVDGAVLVPGFHDAHCHTTSFGLGMAHLELGGTVGVEATLDAVARYAAGLGPGEWVIGFGYGSGVSPEQYPDRHALDRAGAGRPVWLTHVSGHSCLVSSAALAEVGITGALEERGRVVVDDRGEPTGLIEEAAMDLVKHHLGPASMAQLVEAVDRATAHYVTEGITGFTDAGIGCPGIDHSPVELAAYQLARTTGRLHARAQLMVHNELFHPLGAPDADGIATGLDLGVHTGFGDPWLNLGAMKVWVDGSGLGHTAAVTGPGGEVEGAFDNDPALLRQSIIDAHRAGWQVASHAIGDAATDLVLDALEDAMIGEPTQVRSRTSPRHRIEHGVMIRPDQVDRLARLQMTVVVQPQFVTDFGDPLFEMVGGDRGGENFFRMRSLVDAGVAVVGSSDRPVAAGSPLQGMQAMVERTTAGGNVFGPGERLTAAEALECSTVGGARAARCEHQWGSLTARRLADLVVLADDPTAVEPGLIGDIDVVATVIDGRPAHDPSALFGDVGDPSALGRRPT